MLALSAFPCTATCRDVVQTCHILTRKQTVSRRRRPREACTARATNQHSSASVAVSPTQFSVNTWLCPDRAFPIAVGTVAAISWYLWGQMKAGRQLWPKNNISTFDGVLEVIQLKFDHSFSALFSLNFPRNVHLLTPCMHSQCPLQTANAQDGREYRMALARTRQAVAIHRAIGFLNSSNTARAMVELRRALHENSVCRLPLLNTQHEGVQLQQLYRLHLENTAQPADFATLLQLRTLLDIEFNLLII